MKNWMIVKNKIERNVQVWAEYMHPIYWPMQPRVIASDYYAMQNTQVASSNSTSAEKAPFHQSLTTWCCFHLGSSLNSAVLKISKSSIFQAWLAFPQDWFPSPTLGNGLTRKDGHLWQKCLFLSLKNGTWGSKLLRPLLEAQQSPKVMELPFVLSDFQFWVDFQPILKFGICFAIF